MAIRAALPWLLITLAGLVPARVLASALDLAPVPIGAEARLAALAVEDAPTQSAAPGGGMSAVAAPAGRTPGPLGAALRSLLIPGWGQLATGHQSQAAMFGALELGTWTAFGTFEHQGALRRNSYFQTAELFAGIDLSGKDLSYRKLVGQYRSSDIYNQYVVLREATFFYEDPAERAQYIASRSIPAENAWSWGDSYDAFLRYRAQRRSSEQAFKNAQYTLGFAVINRLVSAIAAARSAGSLRSRARQAEGDTSPAQPGHARARLAWEIAPGAGFLPDARVACVLGF